MGFIKGKAYPIVNSMAKKGNVKAKNLLLAAPKMMQEEVDNIVAQLLSRKEDTDFMKEEKVDLEKERETKKEDNKEDKKIEDKEETIKGDLEDEILELIKKEKKLLTEYEENEFAKELKNVINEKKKFISKLESVIKEG